MQANDAANDAANSGANSGASAILVAARGYTRRGWRVVPVQPGAKGVTINAWQRMRLDEHELPQWFSAMGGATGRPRHNVGILTGEPSGGLVDVDCDAPEAAQAAAELLPPTGLISGRAGNPASHYWYRIAGDGEPGAPGEIPATAKFGDVATTLSPSPSPAPGGEPAAEPDPEPDPDPAPDPEPAAGVPDSGSPSLVGEGARGRGMLIELRATGCQTLAPPSVHPSGEVVRWERDGEPGVVSGPALRRAVAHVATVALLARHWPGAGQRDEAAKDLAGLLLRGGWAADETDRFVRLVARTAGDEEWRQRGKARGTARKLTEGAHVTGAPTLAARLGADGARVVAQVRDWLGLSGLGSAHVPVLPIDGHRRP